MLDKRTERRWRIMEGLVFAVAGGVVALFAQWVAHPPIVTIAPPTVNVTSPPVNVTVQPTAAQPSPLKTTHDPKHQRPSPE